MRQAWGGGRRFRRRSPFLQLAGAAAAGLLLANCSATNSDSKYGVAASSRVVEPGQPVPKGGGIYRVGKPYSIAGKTYVPEENINYRADGMASWYGEDFHGRYTANGEVFDMNSISAAHTTLPLPSYVRVTNLRNHRSLIVRVNDRGPYAHNRLIDLSVQSAKLLGFYGHGLAPVRVEYVGKAPLAGSDDAKLVATLRQNGKPMPGQEPPKSVADRNLVRLASAKPFAPEMFDARSMKQVPPAQRPEALAEQEPDASPPQEPPANGNRKITVAAPMIRPVAERIPLSGAANPPSAEPRLTSPVSAYAPGRYDGAMGVMNGRGLY